MNLILGSASKYKQHLLTEAGYRFDIEPSDFDEAAHHQPTVEDTVRVLAELKAQEIVKNHAGEDVIIIATDVAGELDGEFLGKPTSLADAERMILRYSHRKVIVWCGTSIANAKTGEMKTVVSEAEIMFHSLNPAEVKQYVNRQKPTDKGGGIAIEEIEDRGFIKSIVGERSAIIGISLEAVAKALKHFGYKQR